MPAAVIFDMDGVLLDSEPVHYVVLRGVLAAWGLPWSAEDHARTLGMTLVDTWDALCSRHALTAPRGDFEARYGGQIAARYRAGIAPIPGARELVGRLADAGVPIAVASSSPRSWVEAGLEGAGLRECFGHLVAGDEVAAGKPDPEIYLEAARGLGVDPAACIAIEDAPAGVAVGQGRRDARCTPARRAWRRRARDPRLAHRRPGAVRPRLAARAGALTDPPGSRRAARGDGASARDRAWRGGVGGASLRHGAGDVSMTSRIHGASRAAGSHRRGSTGVRPAPRRASWLAGGPAGVRRPE